MLKEIAEKRLAAIKEFTDLGSGFKIAMKDLEIRGAGNLLGKSQSGHMEAVGYDLYCKMLNEEVKRLKGEAVSADEYETLVDIEVSAYIPAEYIRNEVSRLEMYKRIAAIYSDEELLELKDELIDRYGEMPDALDNLINISYIRQLAHEAGATKVESRDEKARIDIYTDIKFDVNKLGSLMAESEGRLKLKSGKDTSFEYRFGDGVHKTKAEDKIKALMGLVKELSLCRLKEEKEG
jgi:TRCF domain